MRGFGWDVLSDNMTTVAYINKHGGTRSPTLMNVAEGLLTWAEQNIASILAKHLKGM